MEIKNCNPKVYPSKLKFKSEYRVERSEGWFTFHFSLLCFLKSFFLNYSAVSLFNFQSANEKLIVQSNIKTPDRSNKLFQSIKLPKIRLRRQFIIWVNGFSITASFKPPEILFIGNNAVLVKNMDSTIMFIMVS